MKILILFVCIAYFTARLIQKEKEPFDKKKVKFVFTRDFLPYKWDEILIFAFGAILGLLIGSGIGQHLINQYLNWSDSSEYATENLVTIVLCFAGGKIADKLHHAK